MECKECTEWMEWMEWMEWTECMISLTHLLPKTILRKAIVKLNRRVAKLKFDGCPTFRQPVPLES